MTITFMYETALLKGTEIKVLICKSSLIIKARYGNQASHVSIGVTPYRIAIVCYLISLPWIFNSRKLSWSTFYIQITEYVQQVEVNFG